MVTGNLAFLLIGLGAIIANAYQIVELDSESFQEFISEHERVMVDFYSPKCPHCKQLAPIYEEVAGVLSGIQADTRLAKINAKANRKLRKKFKVHAYPTLLYFYNGNLVEEYKGIRSVRKISEYLLYNEFNFE